MCMEEEIGLNQKAFDMSDMLYYLNGIKERLDKKLIAQWGGSEVFLISQGKTRKF